MYLCESEGRAVTPGYRQTLLVSAPVHANRLLHTLLARVLLIPYTSRYADITVCTVSTSMLHAPQLTRSAGN